MRLVATEIDIWSVGVEVDLAPYLTLNPVSAPNTAILQGYGYVTGQDI